MQLSNYISNLKWLTISFNRLVGEIENWVEVLAYFMSPVHRSPVKILLRNGDILTIPGNYIFEAVAETLLLNVYGFQKLRSGAVVVDIGASVGDFTLLASRDSDSRVYAFEPSHDSYSYMELNVASNRRGGIRMFNAPANAHTLDLILNAYGEPKIDFLKIDCEGCEYKVLLECSQANLVKIERIAMEIHQMSEFSIPEMIMTLRRAGFSISEWSRRGHGHYLFATRVPT